MEKKIKKLLRNFNSSNAKNQSNLLAAKVEDIYGLELLQTLLVNQPYLPFNNGALRPLGMAFILNEILINRRMRILEFGSGLSSILMSRLRKQNNLEFNIHSVEHDFKWADFIESRLKQESLIDSATIIKAVLKKNQNDSIWYDEEEIEKRAGNNLFDFVIIDGPPAYKEKIKYARLPAANFLKEKLKEDFCILIDDSNRVGEIRLVEEIRQNFTQIKLHYLGDSITLVYRGNYFYSLPF